MAKQSESISYIQTYTKGQMRNHNDRNAHNHICLRIHKTAYISTDMFAQVCAVAQTMCLRS